jgi:TM2 domain-containing membrane protein YozV/Tfp pilus assembly major pilin PilA/ribosomal protein L40E
MSSTAAAASVVLDSKWKKCAECGATLSSKAEVCPKCGAGQGDGKVNKTALLLLTFFLGGFGLHKFYLGKWVQGIFYVLFFWTLIPGLIAFVEFIIYACTSAARLSEKYPNAGSSSAVLIAVAAVFGGIMIIGILAAIAIPAYQDYTLRAKTLQATMQVEPLRLMVEGHIVKTGAIPVDPSEVPGIAPVQIPKLANAQLQNDGIIVLRFDETAGASVAGKTIEYSPAIENGRLVWRCEGGDLPKKYRPTQCRGK